MLIFVGGLHTVSIVVDIFIYAAMSLKNLEWSLVFFKISSIAFDSFLSKI